MTYTVSRGTLNSTIPYHTIDINATGVDSFNRQQTHELNVRRNTVYRTMYNFSS